MNLLKKVNSFYLFLPGASPVRRDFGRGFTGKMIFLAYILLTKR